MVHLQNCTTIVHTYVIDNVILYQCTYCHVRLWCDGGGGGGGGELEEGRSLCNLEV